MKQYTCTNNAAATERMALAEMRLRWGIKRYIQEQRCRNCGTLNRLLNPRERICLVCYLRRTREAGEI